MNLPLREPSLTERLAERLARPVGDDDRARATWHLLDWLGCALVGRASAAGQALAAVVARLPAGTCWLAGMGERDAQAADAAFLHAGLGSVYELDDLHRAAIVHPSDTVVPAALAVAQREGATASALLDAIVRGHEAAIVVGRLAGSRHYQHWYSTATCGVFGAAAAAASLLHLSPEATTDALGLAGMQAAGTWQCREEAGHAKQFATAHAARCGVWAADMVVGGLTGPRRILEGRHGLLVATGAEVATDGEAAFAAATHGATDVAGVADVAGDAEGSATTRHWQIHDVSFKPWPACRHVHPAIEAALALRSRLGSGRTPLDDAWSWIESIDVETYRDALAFADRPLPTTDHEARFSLQHAVAVALTRGEFTLTDASATRRDDPRIAALRAKVRVQVGERFDAAYPTRFGAAVTLHPALTASTAASPDPVTVTAASALGDPEHPLSPDALRWKAATLFDTAGLGSTTGHRLIEACLALSATAPEDRPTLDAMQRFWAALPRQTVPAIDSAI